RGAPGAGVAAAATGADGAGASTPERRRRSSEAPITPKTTAAQTPSTITGVTTRRRAGRDGTPDRGAIDARASRVGGGKTGMTPSVAGGAAGTLRAASSSSTVL